MIKSDLLLGVLREELFHIEIMHQLTVHTQQDVESLHIVFHILLAKVRVIWLQSEVLKDPLPLSLEESSNLLNLG